jgi:hypothetical protein
LAEASIDGSPLIDQQITAFLVLLVTAGYETTLRLLGNAWYWTGPRLPAFGHYPGNCSPAAARSTDRCRRRGTLPIWTGTLPTTPPDLPEYPSAS